jgi:type I restriction enzyme M protein
VPSLRIKKIADTYHAWRAKRNIAGAETHPVLEEERSLPPYEDIPGFCKSATLDEIRAHGHVLTPGRYVGAADVEEDSEPFEEKMARLTVALREQTKQSAKLDKVIWANLEDIGYGG